MKLAVSTLTCKNWTLDKILDHAHGIEALDFRGLQGEMKLWETPEFQSATFRNTLESIYRRNLVVSGISTSARILQTGPEEACDEEVETSVSLAAACGSGYIRIFTGDKAAGPPTQSGIQEIARRYRRLCERTGSPRVRILVETHDVCAASDVLRDVIAKTDHPRAGVIWDVRHPFHLAGEAYEHTASILSPYLGLVHVKDFVDGGNELVAFGTGDIDPPRLITTLRDIDYDGFIVLEQPRVDATGLPAPRENIEGFTRAFGRYRD